MKVHFSIFAQIPASQAINLFSFVFDFKNEKNEDVKKVLNCTTAMNYAIEKAVSNKLLCEIHGILMKDSNNENIGKFRTTQTFLNPHVHSNMMKYNPTSPEDMKPVLNDLEKFIKAKNRCTEPSATQRRKG